MDSMGLVNDINPDNARRENQSQIRVHYITNLNKALLKGKIYQNYHKFVLFDPPKIGDLMTLANCICNFADPSNMRVIVSTKGPAYFLFPRGCST